MAKVGLKNLYVAVMVPDSDIPGVGIGYGVPKRLVGAIEANINPNSNSGTLFGDDGPMETASVIGAIEVEINVNELSLEDQAMVLGHAMSAGQIVRKTTDVAPWVAVGFESLKSNGKKRFTWLYKGKFSVPESKNKTKTDNVEFNTQNIKASFVRRDFDEAYMREADEDAKTYVPTVGAEWFLKVDPAQDVTPLAITSTSPANAATAVPVTSAITWTFTKPIDVAGVTDDNFTIFKDADGADVACVLTVNPAKTIVTATPKTNLATGTAYRIFVSKEVRDLYGNRLTASDIRKFTTA